MRGIVRKGGFVRTWAVLGILVLLAVPSAHLFRTWVQLEQDMQALAEAYQQHAAGKLMLGHADWRAELEAITRSFAAGRSFEGRLEVHDESDRLLSVLGEPQGGVTLSIRRQMPVASGLQLELRVLRSVKPVLWQVLGVGSLTLALGGLIGLLAVLSARRAPREAVLDSLESPVQLSAPKRPEAVHKDGLLTRSAFIEQVRRAATRAAGERERECTVFHLDLDHFKSFNGIVGLDGGDLLLDQVAGALHDRVALLVGEAGLPPAVIAAPGGDVFLILVENLPKTPPVTEAFARGVLEALGHAFEIGSHQLYLSACIGISHLNGRSISAETLLREAELAKNDAKRQGSGSYAIHDQDMDAREQARDVMGNELRQALVQREFQLYYQPKVHLVTGAVTGVEALLRWKPTGRDMVMPDQFVPVLEDTGLIVPVGAWVLREACMQIMAWRRRGMPPISVAVNVSARQLQQRGFVDTVEQVLRETGLEARYLELELTESIFIENANDNVRLLSRLAASGVSLAIDDFGTGHSSLSYLRNFSPRTLKIDRSFLSELPDDGADNIAIARAIIALGHGLGLHVVAEGVETEAQAEFLRGYGCDQMQGYLLSRPRSAEMMEEWLWAHLKGQESLGQLQRSAAHSML